MLSHKKQVKSAYSKSLLLLRRLIFPILLFSSAIIIVWLIWKVPQWQTSGIGVEDKDRAKIENAARSNVVQTFGGLFIFVTAYFSWRNLQVTQQNLVVTQEKQVTERFAKAIEQLGSENIHVRLGAIYALERIAKDSDKDYWQVTEILTTYVRERAPYPPTKKTESHSVTDIQAILTVISRRAKTYADIGVEDQLDFSRSDLSHANLNRANFHNVILYYSNLSGAYLGNANLINGNLIRANLIDTSLTSANLTSAYLSGANLNGANLSSANLSDTYLGNANFSGADLSNANLSGARFWNKDKNSHEAKNITPEQIKQAKNWEKAIYSPEFRKKLGLPPEN